MKNRSEGREIAGPGQGLAGAAGTGTTKKSAGREGGGSMSRGSKPRRALRFAIPVANLRGRVEMARDCPESRYDFMIICTIPVAFIRVKFAAGIRATLREIAVEFREAIRELTLITNDTTVSRELWPRSKYGTMRFFRIVADGLAELGGDGPPLAG